MQARCTCKRRGYNIIMAFLCTHSRQGGFKRCHNVQLYKYLYYKTLENYSKHMYKIIGVAHSRKRGKWSQISTAECAEFKVWMTFVESGWNVWVWLVGVVSRRWVWLVGVGGIYGCG